VNLTEHHPCQLKAGKYIPCKYKELSVRDRDAPKFIEKSDLEKVQTNLTEHLMVFTENAMKKIITH
jgi:hypothetical protein